MVWVDNYPCPHGPGFVRQLPSVKGNVVPSGSPSSCPVSVLSLALAGRLCETLMSQAYSNTAVHLLTSRCSLLHTPSSSIIWILTPVSFSITLACVRASLIGEVEGRGMSCEWSFSVMLFRSIFIGCLMWGLIVSVPDHCLSFLLCLNLSKLSDTGLSEM